MDYYGAPLVWRAFQAFWRQVGDRSTAVCRHGAELGEDVGQIDERIDVYALAGLDDGVQVSKTAAAVITSGMQPCFSSSPNRREISLRTVVRQMDSSVVEESLQRIPMIHAVTNGLRHFLFGGIARGGGCHPRRETVEDWLRILDAAFLSLIMRVARSIGFVLDLKQRGDPGDRRSGIVRGAHASIDELVSGVGLMWSST